MTAFFHSVMHYYVYQINIAMDKVAVNTAYSETWERIRGNTTYSGLPHQKVIQVGHQLCFPTHIASGTSLCTSLLLLLLLLLSSGPLTESATLL